MDQGTSAGATVDDDAFVITRVFDAPCVKMFEAWSHKDQLLRWFAPPGMTVTAKTADLRPGGVFHYSMQMPGGRTIWGHWAFRDIAAPARMVFLATFSDEAGGLGRNPWIADWPAQVLTAVTFAEHDGRTTMTLHAVPVDATMQEHAVFRAGHAPMRQGWTGTLDKLADYLSKA